MLLEKVEGAIMKAYLPRDRKLLIVVIALFLTLLVVSVVGLAMEILPRLWYSTSSPSNETIIEYLADDMGKFRPPFPASLVKERRKELLPLALLKYLELIREGKSREPLFHRIRIYLLADEPVEKKLEIWTYLLRHEDPAGRYLIYTAILSQCGEKGRNFVKSYLPDDPIILPTHKNELLESHFSEEE